MAPAPDGAPDEPAPGADLVRRWLRLADAGYVGDSGECFTPD